LQAFQLEEIYYCLFSGPLQDLSLVIHSKIPLGLSSSASRKSSALMAFSQLGFLEMTFWNACIDSTEFANFESAYFSDTI